MLSVVRASNLAEDGSGGVGIVAEVHGEESPFAEGLAPMEGPEGGLQAVHHVAGAANAGGCLRLNEPEVMAAIFGARGTSFHMPGTGQNPGESN